MSKLSSNSSSVKQLKSALQSQFKQSKDMSLFDKLQIYDRIIAQSKIRQTDNKALSIFQQLIYEHGNSIMNGHQIINNGNQKTNIKQKGRNFVGSVYSSPPNLKNQIKDIEDPQLFSFSKTRKQTQNKHQKMTQNGILRTSIFNNLKNNKSANPRYYIPNNKQLNQRNVSQFNSQYTELANQNNNTKNENNIQLSLHELTKQLKTYLLNKNITTFLNVIRININLNKKNTNLKTTQSLYQLNLLKKSMAALKKYNNETNKIVQQFQMTINGQKLFTVFSEWYNYVNRSEDEKLREKQIKAKKILLMKTMGIRKFIQQSTMIINEKNDWNNSIQNINFKQYKLNKSKQLQNKKNKIIKWITLNTILNRQKKNKLLNLKLQQIKHIRLQNNVRIFIKLINCLKDSQELRNQKLGYKVSYKVNSMVFMTKLKKQYHFQKAYWTNNNGLQIDMHEKNKKHISLNHSYQKIMFIFELLDCVQHNLNRKGYTFLQKDNNLYQSLLQTIKYHPAYQHYYRIYKQIMYFNAIKNVLLVQTKQKINKIKYQIIGKRVLKNGLLSWYKNYLQQSVFDTHIEEKYNQLTNYLHTKHINQFYKVFSTNIKINKHSEVIKTNLFTKSSIKALMILKTYAISKKYYRTIILQNKLNKKNKILESYFVQWKLYYVQNMHNRLLQKDISLMRKKNAINAIKQNLQLYSLSDKIYRKKCENLRSLKKNDYVDMFLSLLRKNWQIKQKNSRQSKTQLNFKINQIKSYIEYKSKTKFIIELTQNWYHKRLQQQILNQIQKQYQQKFLFKIFTCMKSMVKVEKQEKEKIKAIQVFKYRRMKKQILGIMIEKLISKLILNKMIKVIKSYWLKKLRSNIRKIEQKQGQQKQHSFET